MSEVVRHQMTPCKFCVPMVPGGETFIALKRKQHLSAEPRKDSAKSGKLSPKPHSSIHHSRHSPRETSSVDSSSDTMMDVDTPRSNYYSDSHSDASYSPYTTPRDSYFMPPRERIQTLEEFFDVRLPIGPAVRPSWPSEGALPLYPSLGADFDDLGSPGNMSYASDCSDALDYNNGFDSWDPFASPSTSSFNLP